MLKHTKHKPWCDAEVNQQHSDMGIFMVQMCKGRVEGGGDRHRNLTYTCKTDLQVKLKKDRITLPLTLCACSLQPFQNKEMLLCV